MIAAQPTTDGARSIRCARAWLRAPDHRPVQHRLLRRERRPRSSACCSRRCTTCGSTDIVAGRLRHRRLSRANRDDDESFRENMPRAIDEFMRVRAEAEGPAVERLRQTHQLRQRPTSTTRSDFVNAQSAARRERRAASARGGNRLFYLSTPPPVFPKIIEHLRRAGLGPHDDDQGWTRIIVEKPFGTDLDSARALQREIDKVFDENADLSHRPLSRQRAGAGHHGAALREHDLRADLEPPLRRQRPDHGGRDRSASRSAAATTTTPARCAT